MFKIDRLGNRIVAMTVILVALAGLLVSAASYVRTRSLANSYKGAMETELGQKGLAYGQTAQSLLNAVASSSPQAFQSLLRDSINSPDAIITKFNAGTRGDFQDTPLGYEAWVQDPSAPGGYTLLFRRSLTAERSATAEDPSIRPLVARTAATGEPSTRVNENDRDLHYSFLIQLDPQTKLIVVATLDASQEFAFISKQRHRAIRDAIFFAAGSVLFVSLVGGGLSFLVSRTLTNRKRAEETLREQTRRDSLTHVLNHAAIIDELRGAIAAVDDDTTCAIAMVDVDGLKAVNDTYGHQAGDALLISVAHAMSRRGAIVGRYGGDEFLAIIPSAGRVEAEQYRDEVAAALADARVIEAETGATVSVAASIGLAIYPEDGRTAHEILDLSDSAMYSSRRQRPAGPGELSPSRTLGGERAAAMVGQIVPLLTASGPIENKLRRVAHRLSVSAGYDAVNVDVFAQASGLPSARNTFSHVPDEVVDAWQSERRRMEDEPILRHIKSTRHALIVEDPQNDERLTEAQLAVLRAAELQSAVVVPLFWEDDMIGALSVASKRKNAFTAEDIEFLTAVATQVTAIVRMATLVDELQASSTHLEQAHGQTVLLLAAAAEAHDATTGQHLQRVQVLVEALARELGQSEEEAHTLGTAATLHDVGKLFVPESVLARNGPLDIAAWELMARHTTLGQQFLNGHPGFELAATIARHHHERWDGHGYPDRLTGDDIPETATIVTVADAFDAMTSDRPYAPPVSPDSAVMEIRACSGKQFSPRVVDALVRLHARGALPVLEGAARAA